MYSVSIVIKTSFSDDGQCKISSSVTIISLNKIPRIVTRYFILLCTVIKEC